MMDGRIFSKGGRIFCPFSWNSHLFLLVLLDLHGMMKVEVLKGRMDVQKKSVIITGAIILIFAFVIGVYQSNTANSAPKLNEDEVSDIVLDQYPGDIEDLSLEKKNKQAVYTVALVYENKGYKLQVDGNSGEIIHVKELPGSGDLVVKDEEENAHDNMLEEDKSDDADKGQDVSDKEEKDDTPDTSGKDQSSDENGDASDDSQDKPKEKKDKDKEKDEPKKDQQSSDQKKDSSTVLSAIEAIGLAQEQFPGTVIELERDKNNGRTIFEIELVGNGEKAELELDAMNGKVISLKIKSDKKAESKYGGAPIDMAEAIRIALSKFSGIVDDVELEIDNGRFAYEVEIINNGREAEMLIDGHTGEILEYDPD